MALIIVLAFFAFAVIVVLNAAAKVVPQQEAWVVERLGRFEKTLTAGLHLLVPFVEAVRYRHPLKEQIITVDEQDCITKDNVLIKVDAVLYFQIIDPVKASYGIADPELGIVQLSQTTVRSEIGKIDLDRTFEERPNINAQIVGEIDKASIAWGVKVLRYEIKNIKPPIDIREAMERQMRAEREKRAVILESEGRRDALIEQRRGQEAGRDKIVGSRKAASNQRGGGTCRGDSLGRQRDRRRNSRRRQGDHRIRRLRGGAASRRRAVHPGIR